MKLPRVLLLAMAVPILATTLGHAQTTLDASAGSVSSTMIGTLQFEGGGSAVAAPNLAGCYFTGYSCSFIYGTVSFLLPDGRSAKLSGFHGTMRYDGGSVYTVDGSASGTDSNGNSVTVSDIQFTFYVRCLSGRGGGCTKTYLTGSMTIK
jgi:hypothetical protein